MPPNEQPDRESWAFTDDEFAFVQAHPGGFDREFFVAKSRTYFDAFCDENGLDPKDAEVLVKLASGDEISVKQILSSLTYTLLVAEDGEFRWVPHSHVVQVRYRARPGPRPEKTIGFTVGATSQEPTASS